jgi:hypothetical protein
MEKIKNDIINTSLLLILNVFLFYIAICLFYEIEFSLSYENNIALFSFGFIVDFLWFSIFLIDNYYEKNVSKEIFK